MIWIDMNEKIPSNGQRCLVWNNRYKLVEIAYFYINNNTFEIWRNGENCIIPGTSISYWMNEPIMSL